MADPDPNEDYVETETPVFTEQEVFMIASFVARVLGFEEADAILAATRRAIPAVLSYKLNGGE